MVAFVPVMCGFFDTDRAFLVLRHDISMPKDEVIEAACVGAWNSNMQHLIDALLIPARSGRKEAMYCLTRSFHQWTAKVIERLEKTLWRVDPIEVGGMLVLCQSVIFTYDTIATT